MGYWSKTQGGTVLLWGDAPADLLDDALDAIKKAFAADLGREPTDDEIRYGLEFSLAGEA